MFLESKFGRKNFDVFLRNYFDTHAFQSIDTKNFLIYIEKNLVNKHPGKVSMEQIVTWIKEPMLPSNAPKPRSDAFANVQKNMNAWLANDLAIKQMPSKEWTVHEWLYFINNLPENITLAQLAELDKQYNLTQSSNNEIAHAWLLLSINKGNKAVYERLEDYLISIGRRKLIVPLYRALIETNGNDQFAKRVYKIARPGYHPLAQGTIDNLFNKSAN